MCWLTETYHAPCNHWGAKRAETPCARADFLGLKSGCCNSTVCGTTRVETRCPACLFRDRIAEEDANDGDEEEEDGQRVGEGGENASLGAWSRSSVVSTGTGDVSESDEEENSTYNYTELDVEIVDEEEKLGGDVKEKEEEKDEGQTDEQFGTRFGGWMSFIAEKLGHGRNPWDRGWNGRNQIGSGNEEKSVN